jgi:hypothetical protein
LQRPLPVPWIHEVSFLPRFGQHLAERLHELGFILDSTRYMHTFFGCREVLFKNDQTGIWVRIFFDGAEGEWLLFMAVANGGEAPVRWLPARNWLQWAGLIGRSLRNDQVNEVLAA